MRAAVLMEGQHPLAVVDDIEVSAPAAGQVLVNVTHCGICHSDLTIIETGIGPLPMVLGHEAAGVVEAVGPGVTSLVPGDHVVLVAIAPCGRCYWCVRGKTSVCEKAMSFMAGTLPDGSTALSRGGQPVYRGLGVGGFAEQVLTTESGVVRIDPDVPLDLASVIGCAIQTGVGAVLNTAGVEEGATVLVMGLGGVGMAVVQGARLAGASRIIASDPLVDRRTSALSFGATDVYDPADGDLAGFCLELTGVGVDYAFDAAGQRPAPRGRRTGHLSGRHHGVRGGTGCQRGLGGPPGHPVRHHGEAAGRLPVRRRQPPLADPAAGGPVAAWAARSGGHDLGTSTAVGDQPWVRRPPGGPRAADRAHALRGGGGPAGPHGLDVDASLPKSEATVVPLASR